ncbi:CGNR zinc finger domain-containing protein [Pseudonocardia endophytica]|uniref:Putative stress-induced transcription regulator n=1 Tax=Pseudonocardia endophytica TaxID=401976 RepID=A0A4R1IA68_PSEEN|nr:CGNR zinc finger domain-containing protein [Pseudonocardia endophytica]TCK27212.1 putative stress-induced transcription regulator [Pseudonocardia endophytica]
MKFAHDTEVALTAMAALVNTEAEDPDPVTDRALFDDWLVEFPYTGVRLGTDEELASVRAVRARLRGLWEAPDRDATVALVNELLGEAGAQPYLTRHDGWDWHLHVTPPDAPLAQRVGAEAAMAVVDLVRSDDLERLRRCAGDDCDAVLVDLSRNRSRRFCDTGNCANRAHVAAYRARRATEG